MRHTETVKCPCKGEASIEITTLLDRVSLGATVVETLTLRDDGQVGLTFADVRAWDTDEKYLRAGARPSRRVRVNLTLLGAIAMSPASARLLAFKLLEVATEVEQAEIEETT